MRTIAVKLAELATRLHVMARKRGTTQSALVREALEAHLRQGMEGGPRSCLDSVWDLAGSVAGPADLSSNRRRLRAYGR